MEMHVDGNEQKKKRKRVKENGESLERVSFHRRSLFLKHVPPELKDETIRELLEHYGGPIEQFKPWRAVAQSDLISSPERKSFCFVSRLRKCSERNEGFAEYEIA